MLKLPTDKRLSPHKRGYGAKWRKLRNAFIATNPLCRFCLRLGNIVGAQVVDHIKPHRGDAKLLYDMQNLQSLCFSCHDKHKQRQEKSGYLVGADVDGNPVDENHHWHINVEAVFSPVQRIDAIQVGG